MELRKQNTGSNGTNVSSLQNNQGSTQNSGNYNPNSSR